MRRTVMGVLVIALAAVSLAIILLWPKITRRIPGSIIALLGCTLAVAALGLPVETIGSKFGGIPQGLPPFAIPAVRPELIIPLLPSVTSDRRIFCRMFRLPSTGRGKLTKDSLVSGTKWRRISARRGFSKDSATGLKTPQSIGYAAFRPTNRTGRCFSSGCVEADPNWPQSCNGFARSVLRIFLQIQGHP